MPASTALTKYTVRCRHSAWAWASATSFASPRRKVPTRPDDSAATPTTRTHTVLVPSRREDAGSSHQRGTFQLRESGSVSEASRHSRSSLMNTSPAMPMPSIPSPSSVERALHAAPARSQSMRYQAVPL